MPAAVRRPGQRIERARVRERLHDRPRHRGPAQEVPDVGERPLARAPQDRADLGVGDPVDVLQRQPDAELALAVDLLGDVLGLARFTSSGRIGMPWRRASSSSAAVGTSPGRA